MVSALSLTRFISTEPGISGQQSQPAITIPQQSKGSFVTVVAHTLQEIWLLKGTTFCSAYHHWFRDRPSETVQRPFFTFVEFLHSFLLQAHSYFETMIKLSFSVFPFPRRLKKRFGTTSVCKLQLAHPFSLRSVHHTYSYIL